MTLIETERFNLREVAAEDAAFIMELVNEPLWKQNIGERNVNSLEDARAFIERAFTGSYKNNGFGLYLVELKNTGEPVGISGLVKRDSLPDPDIGFAFLSKFHGRGYATEAGHAILKHARETLGIQRILAITTPANDASGNVLEKIGLKFKEVIKLDGIDGESKLYE